MNPAGIFFVNHQKYDNLTDEEVVQRVLHSEKQMYEVILHRYSRRLYHIINSILKEPEASKEALQLTYVKAYEKLSQFTGRSGFGTWFTRIAINESLKGLKREKRLANRSGNDLQVFPEYHYRIHNEYDGNPEANIIWNEIRYTLDTAIRSLPEKYRIVFVMREIKEMNVEDTALSLNISMVNVKVRLHRAKILLRELLRKYRLDEESFPGNRYVFSCGTSTVYSYGE